MTVESKQFLDFPNISKFVDEPNLRAIAEIQDYCDKNGCPESVPYSNKIELIHIRDGFASKVLGLSPELSEHAIQKVCHTMRDTYPVRRVTFLYLLAEYTGTIEIISPSAVVADESLSVTRPQLESQCFD